MRPLLMLILAATLIGAAGAQDSSQKERGKKKVYTNEDLERLKQTHPVSQAEQKPQAPGSKKQNTEGRKGYRDVNGNGRAYWQKRIQPLRQKLENLDAQIASLREQQKNVTPGTSIKVTPRGRLRSAKNNPQSLENRIAGVERKRQQVLKEIGDLEEEARKAQALPEWLR